MDLNGDQHISVKELVQMGDVIRKGKEESARLKKVIFGILLMFIMVLGVFLCMVVAGVEATKENHTSKSGPPVLVDLDGKVIGTASAQNTGPLRSDLPFDTLAAMSTLRLVSEPGNVTHFFKIAGFERDPAGLLTLYTHQGLASTLYVKEDEVWMTGEKGAKIILRKKGRRLLADDNAVTSAATTGVGGGCNGEAEAGTPCVQTTAKVQPAITNGMCICEDEWSYGSMTFRDGKCANPDGDSVGEWCVVRNDVTGEYGGIANCHGTPFTGDSTQMWDYCRTTPATRTKAKCACHAKWTYMGQSFKGTCGTPDGDSTPWCATVEGTCSASPAGIGWDYCDPPRQSLNAAESTLMNTAPTPTAAAAPSCDTDRCCEPTAPMKKAKWTFMVYGVSDNNLEAFMGKDLKEMAEAGFGGSEDVHMIVIADRGKTGPNSKSYDDSNWLNQAAFHTMKTFYVADKKITCLKDHGEGDMSKVDTFVNFTVSTVKNFPAEKYGVIYWNHGIGWHGFGGDQTPGTTHAHKGTQHFEAFMDLPGLVKTLEESLAKTGLPKFDLVGFDACSMATTVVTNHIAKYADVLVYSEDTEPGHGWDYTVFKDVVATPSLPPVEVAKKIIGGLQSAYETYKQTPVTLTAVVTSDWNAFFAKFTALLDEFTAKVLKPSGTLYSCSQINGVQTFAEAVKGDGVTKLEYYMVDVGNLVDAMRQSAAASESSVPSLVALADQTMALYRKMQPVAMAKSSDRAKSTGLGVLYPKAEYVDILGLNFFTKHDRYGPLQNFSAHTSASYDAFLEQSYKAGAGVAKALDTPSFTSTGLKFTLPSGMVSSFPFYRNGLRSVKIGCVIADATTAEKVSLGCGDYTIDKWTNNPVSIDVALAYHVEDLRTIPKSSCFYRGVFDSTCPPVFMLKGETNSKALTGFTSYYGTTNGQDPNVVHVYGALLPGGGEKPSVGPIRGSSTQGPILDEKKDPNTCNGRTMSSAPNYGARADWDGVSYHIRQRKYIAATTDATTGHVTYGSSRIVVEEAPGYAESSYKTSLLGWTDGSTEVGDNTTLVSKVTKIHVAYYPDGNPVCVDKDPFCSQHAAHGECKNTHFDQSQCAKSCGKCETKYYEAYLLVKEEPKVPAGCIKGGGYVYCVRPASLRLDYSQQTVSTALYAKLPGSGWAEVRRGKSKDSQGMPFSHGFVPYILTSSSKDADDGNGTLAGGPRRWYKDFRLAHGKFFEWDEESEVSLHRKLRAAELGIDTRAVLFGIAEDVNNRKAVLSSWTPVAVGGKKRRRALQEAEEEEEEGGELAVTTAIVNARDKMEERTVTTVMKPATPERGDKDHAYIHGITDVASPKKNK